VVVNMKKVKLPESYVYPAHISSRPRDFKLAWFLINELGIGVRTVGTDRFQSSLRMEMHILWKIGCVSQCVGQMIG
jgi:hypothetical protein